MNLLLDTTSFLWWLQDDPRLPATAREAIADPTNEVSVSVATAWELAIKAEIGRFVTTAPLGQFLEEQIHLNGFTIQPVLLDHAVSVAALPGQEHDPFGRLLAAQAAALNLTLVTGNPALRRCGVSTLW